MVAKLHYLILLNILVLNTIMFTIIHTIPNTEYKNRPFYYIKYRELRTTKRRSTNPTQIIYIWTKSTLDPSFLISYTFTFDCTSISNDKPHFHYIYLNIVNLRWLIQNF